MKPDAVNVLSHRCGVKHPQHRASPVDGVKLKKLINILIINSNIENNLIYLIYLITIKCYTALRDNATGTELCSVAVLRYT